MLLKEIGHLGGLGCLDRCDTVIGRGLQGVGLVDATLVRTGSIGNFGTL